MFARLFLCALLIGAVGASSAQGKPAQTQQQPATRQPTPEQRAAIQKRNQTLVNYANQIIKMIDNGQAAQVWDGMSEVGKKAVTRDNFAKQVQQQRAKLGQAKSRKIVALYGRKSNGKELPAGIYMNVRYVTQFADSTKPKIELVSFHLDSDRKWRVSGYTCQDVPQKSATATPKR